MNSMDGWLYSPPPQTQRSSNRRTKEGVTQTQSRACQTKKWKKPNKRHAVSCAERCTSIKPARANLLLLFTNFVSRCTMLCGKAWRFYAKRVKLIVLIFVRKQRMRILIRHQGPQYMLTQHYVENIQIFERNCQAAELKWDRTSCFIFLEQIRQTQTNLWVCCCSWGFNRIFTLLNCTFQMQTKLFTQTDETLKPTE